MKDNKDNLEELESQGQEESTESQAKEEEQPLSHEEELKFKLSEVNDKYLRLYSDFENYRKRTAKEKIELINASNRDLLATFLPVLDDFERAIASNESIEDPTALKEGFLLIYNKINNLMELEGVKPMNAIGKPFDVEYHEAITNVPAPKSSMKGKVMDVTEKGYFLKEKVLRYAKVVVGA
jgi:molecular chaperone GrpE